MPSAIVNKCISDLPGDPNIVQTAAKFSQFAGQVTFERCFSYGPSNNNNLLLLGVR